MRFAIAYSKKDIAGINIAKQLKSFFLPQIPVIELKKDTIFSDNLDQLADFKNIDFIVFASKHKAESKKPSLSLHAPGNWRNADFGGKPGKICKNSAFVSKYLFQNLNKIAKGLEEYEITLEVTHHGPLINKPCCFIELGSCEKQWADEKAAKIIASTIASLQNYKINQDWIPCFGIGGPHYAPNFNKIQLNSEYAISFIIPEYAFPLTPNMLEEAEKKTIENIKYVLIDWKGCGKSEERQKTINLLNQLGFYYKRTSSIKTKDDDKNYKG